MCLSPIYTYIPIWLYIVWREVGALWVVNVRARVLCEAFGCCVQTTKSINIRSNNSPCRSRLETRPYCDCHHHISRVVSKEAYFCVCVRVLRVGKEKVDDFSSDAQQVSHFHIVVESVKDIYACESI